jgi:type II secretory pathway pseudopilin PulG
MTTRRGKTLIEMLILITVLSVVLASVSLVLLGAFKTDRQLRRDLAQQTSLARLASRFRSDAHAATTCRVDNACELSLADGRVVRYGFAGQRISREVRRGQTLEHQDAFVLPDTAAVRFEQPEAFGGRLVRVSISAKENADKAHLTPVRPSAIEAAIGIASSRKENP